MKKQQATSNVTEMIISALKSEIGFHQQKACEALKANLPEVCADHLNKQGVAIDNLIKLAATHASSST